MAVDENQPPTGDGDPHEWVGTGVSDPNLYQAIDEGIGSHNPATYVYSYINLFPAGDPESFHQRFTFDALPGDAVLVTDVQIRVYAKTGWKGGPEIQEIYLQWVYSGGPSSELEVEGLTNGFTLKTVNWNGLSIPAADFNAGELNCRGYVGSGNIPSVYIATMDRTVTYTVPSGNAQWYYDLMNRRN